METMRRLAGIIKFLRGGGGGRGLENLKNQFKFLIINWDVISWMDQLGFHLNLRFVLPIRTGLHIHKFCIQPFRAQNECGWSFQSRIIGARCIHVAFRYFGLPSTTGVRRSRRESNHTYSVYTT